MNFCLILSVLLSSLSVSIFLFVFALVFTRVSMCDNGLVSVEGFWFMQRVFGLILYESEENMV